MSYYEDEADYTPEMYENDLETHETNLVYKDTRAEVEAAERDAREACTDEANERPPILVWEWLSPEHTPGQTSAGDYDYTPEMYEEDHHLDASYLNDRGIEFDFHGARYTVGGATDFARELLAAAWKARGRG